VYIPTLRIWVNARVVAAAEELEVIVAAVQLTRSFNGGVTYNNNNL